MLTMVAGICPSIEAGIVDGRTAFRFVPTEAGPEAAIAAAEANLRRIVPLLAEAAARGAKIACLPEDLMGLTHWNKAAGRRGTTRRRVHAATWSRFCQVLSDAARGTGMVVCAGAYETTAEGSYNAAALFNANGRLLGTYRKVQLAPGEARILRRGASFPVFRTRHGRIGICICWDIIFPEVTQALMANGADLILHPTWGHSGAQADFTIQARAHDAGTPIIVAMWCGGPIVDRDGTILARATASRDERGIMPDQIVYAEIDLKARRQWLVSHDHKRRLLRERPHALAAAGVVPDRPQENRA